MDWQEPHGNQQGKCQVLHVGWNNLMQQFSMVSCLESSFSERDLGVLVDLKLNVWQQYATVAKPGIASRSREVILLFYSTLVRPQLEYCVHSGVPQFKKLIDKLEQDQQRVTRMVRGQEPVMFEERQSELALSSLMKRRPRGDVFALHNSVTGARLLCVVHADKMKGNGHKLQQGKFIQIHDLFRAGIASAWVTSAYHSRFLAPGHYCNRFPNRLVNTGKVMLNAFDGEKLTILTRRWLALGVRRAVAKEACSRSACLGWRQNVYRLTHSEGQGKEDGARLFSGIFSERTRDNGHKLKYKKFHLNDGEKAETEPLGITSGSGITQHLYQRPGEGCVLWDSQEDLTKPREQAERWHMSFSIHKGKMMSGVE
ncbi:hypothetical protein QYF61_013165 [Mycteria americana]|uniref:Uncharacterized protein n=1 Tax=Mycteria americana TaxID=33587 RepID=A0AAN7PR09_MYCAM|nr:hypothetical protein QYF61_013165 [Mycteria americana]